jgi:hypothetical protein
MSLLSRLAVQAARAYGILSSNPNNVPASYLAVAGGGGGGAFEGAGGGAGGYQTSTFTLSTLNTYSITVGAGGTSAGSSAGAGNNGSNSVISGTGLTTVTSVGGGGGGGLGSQNGKNGGSGGGASSNSTTVGLATSGQGNNGGLGTGVPGAGTGGGGGGAGEAGNTDGASYGGDGLASSISGTSTYYAGGGAGYSGSGPQGGLGGGGNLSTAGTANTGGGGGAWDGVTPAGAGGSGVVIISYASATPKFVGGTLTTSGGNQIHTFTSSGTLSPLTPVTASYLVVAGGGGTAGNRNGGGGAGGLLTSSTTLYSGATYVVTVGAGGAGGAGNAAVTSAQDGSNSVISGTGLTTLTATGGGGGGGTNNPSSGRAGGSGGGAGGDNATGATGGTGVSGQGFAGGTSATGGGAGGGGASAVGSNGTSNTGGNGGAGTASSITGTSVTYAGGGGGGATTTAGTGGAGGGGDGAQGSPTTQLRGVNGTQNLGGGAGGGSNYGSTPVTQASGGSGVVIISYAGSQVFNGGLVTSSGGNTIHTFNATGALTPLTNNLTNSLRFRLSAGAYLSRTPALSGNRKTWTWSAWVKRGTLSVQLNTLFVTKPTSSPNDTNTLQFSFNSDNALTIGLETAYYLTTTQVFRDPSAWYHLVLAVDTTQATAANRIKMYVNGNQITAFSVDLRSSITQNQDLGINLGSQLHQIGALVANSWYFDGYMDDINFIDGQALEPYYFGNNDANGVWKPILYKGTYGTNGFYLTFTDTSAATAAAIGKDTSGNGNNWTPNNISVTAGATYDAMTDVPTNTSATVANYAVMSPIDFISANGTISSANLNWASSTNVCGNRATIGATSGKWYWEAVGSSVTSGTVGGRFAFTGGDTTTVEQDKFGMYWHPNSGISRIVNGTDTNVTSAYTYTNGDVLALALDLDNNISYWYKNGALQYTYDFSSFSTIGTRVFFAYAWNGSSGTPSWVYNFGQRPFAYTPPTGFVALNTFNLPTPTILQGNKYMDATLYTGNGSTQVIVNQALFKPDLVWQKPRNEVASHRLVDSVRGVNKVIKSNSTDAEATETNALTAFNSNGFTGGGSNAVSSGNTAVAWQWQAGQGSTTTGTGTGGITSVTQSVNTTSGFSIVTYTGSGSNGTVTHGLGIAPSWVLVKSRTIAENWMNYHTSIGATNYIYLDGTGGAVTLSTIWNNTAPTSSVFSVGTNVTVNQSSTNYVAYCFAEIAGFSKFSSYTGNGSADGPFVYLGFRPKFILVKQSSSAGNAWQLLDSSRNTYNKADNALFPNSTAVEGTGNATFDFLSNGVKIRAADGTVNTNASTYIYMAFAENPFKNANAR